MSKKLKTEGKFSLEKAVSQVYQKAEEIYNDSELDKKTLNEIVDKYFNDKFSDKQKELLGDYFEEMEILNNEVLDKVKKESKEIKKESISKERKEHILSTMVDWLYFHNLDDDAEELLSSRGEYDIDDGLAEGIAVIDDHIEDIADKIECWVNVIGLSPEEMEELDILEPYEESKEIKKESKQTISEKTFGNWKVVVVKKDGKLVVEFYDTFKDSKNEEDKINFPDGQFITSYSLDTLLGKDGYDKPIESMDMLKLDLDVPAWTINKSDLKDIGEWLRTFDEDEKKLRVNNDEDTKKDDNKLPEFCFTYVYTDGCIGKIKNGETGYYPVNVPLDKWEAGEERDEAGEKIARELNASLNIDEDTQKQMEIGSLYGFDKIDEKIITEDFKLSSIDAIELDTLNKAIALLQKKFDIQVIGSIDNDNNMILEVKGKVLPVIDAMDYIKENLTDKFNNDSNSLFKVSRTDLSSSNSDGIVSAKYIISKR